MKTNLLEMSKQLKKDGFTESQAEAIVKQIMIAIQKSDLVTKDFLDNKLAALKSDLIAPGARKFAELEVKFSGLEIKITESEKRMTGQTAGLGARITESEERMLALL